MLMWILGGWNIEGHIFHWSIFMHLTISLLHYITNSMPEICQNNFTDLQLCWNIIVTFLYPCLLYDVFHKKEYSHLKSVTVNNQAFKEGWPFLSQGHEKYFSSKYLAVTSNSCKEANWEKKISFKTNASDFVNFGCPCHLAWLSSPLVWVPWLYLHK